MIENERPHCGLCTKDFYYDLPESFIAQEEDVMLPIFSDFIDACRPENKGS